MRVFKEADFARWARKERIPDKTICDAAADVAEGKVEADLGDWLFKKRVARPGKGKRGGWRMIIGYRRRHTDRIVFLFGFAKNESSTLTVAGHKALAVLAKGYIQADDTAVQRLLADGELVEVMCDEGRNQQDSEDGASGREGAAPGGSAG